MNEQIVQQVGQSPKSEVDLDTLHRDRAAVKRRKKAIMDAQGTYPLARWAKRWGYVAAGYLAYYVTYAGTQKDPNGWTYKSAEEMYEETGITPRQQERCRKLFVAVGVLEAKKKGIGNKWNVRVNFPMLELVDGLPSFEEVEAEVEAPGEQTFPTNREPKPALHSPQKVESIPRKVETIPRNVGTHKSNTQEHDSNILSPNPRIAGETDGRLGNCLAVLEEMEMDEKNRRNVAEVLPELLARFPSVNPVDACRKYPDKVTGRTIRDHSKYLAGHFKMEAEEIASESPHPHSPEAERAREKPNPYRWFAAFYDVDEATYRRMVDSGMTQTEMVAALGGRAA